LRKHRNVAATIAVVAVIAASLFVLGGVAQAKTYNTRVSIDYADGHFVGKLSSGSGECEVHRVVKIFKKTGDGKVLSGKDTTNNRGRYNVELMTANGKYFARAVKTTPMADTICRRADSDTITV